MIDETLKNQYKSIKAPGDLKETILADAEISPSYKSKRKVNRYLQLVAACFVAILVISFIGAGAASTTVYSNGEVFYEDVVSIEGENLNGALRRATINEDHLIEIDAKLETKISISKGEITLTDCETGEHIYTGNEYSVKGKVKLSVNLPEGECGVVTLENILSRRDITFETGY